MIEHHHDLGYDDRNANFVLLIGLCSRISRQWLLNTNYDPMQEEELLKTLNLKTDALESYLDKCRKKLDGIVQLVDNIAA